jgi:hypothetical protein
VVAAKRSPKTPRLGCPRASIQTVRIAPKTGPLRRGETGSLAGTCAEEAGAVCPGAAGAVAEGRRTTTGAGWGVDH